MIPKRQQRDGASTVLMWLRWATPGLVTGLIALTSCGGSHEPDGYGPEHRTAFAEDCAAGGITTRTCECFYDRLALEVPFDRFVQLDEELWQSPTDADVPAAITAMAAACAAQHQGTGDD